MVDIYCVQNLVLIESQRKAIVTFSTRVHAALFAKQWNRLVPFLPLSSFMCFVCPCRSVVYPTPHLPTHLCLSVHAEVRRTLTQICLPICVLSVHAEVRRTLTQICLPICICLHQYRNQPAVGKYAHIFQNTDTEFPESTESRRE